MGRDRFRDVESVHGGYEVKRRDGLHRGYRMITLFLELVGITWALGCVGMFMWIFLTAFSHPVKVTLVAVDLFGEADWEVWLFSVAF